MTKKRLWITRRLSDATLDRAKRDYDVVINYDDTPGTAADLIAASADFDAIIPCHSELFSPEVVAQFSDRLQIVANHSVGVDHCDLPALEGRKIVVTNTPDVLSDATAELAMLLMLGAARHAVAGDRIVRTGSWDSWSPAFMVGKQVTGARLGIVGMGRVGRAFAAKARGFDMEIHYFNRSELPPHQAQSAIYHDSVESLLEVADFLSLHCPATPETLDLMNVDRFARLPTGAVIVNTARGALVDEDALMAALDSGQVAAAGLDCFKIEPGGNPALAKYDNIFMLPHIGSATRTTRDAMGFRALDNLDEFFAGKIPKDTL
ncbi:2-hydroxyacid dehydrogenase [Planktotalea arctica]|uniref:2-hydroxyacid dehydrogenase n=1 Tax=Planktotalea arctica TaxID=1481893 RepID=UPI000A1750A4|nr:D-glycerate dehydrogenase [Planktotalea arctica]